MKRKRKRKRKRKIKRKIKRTKKNKDGEKENEKEAVGGGRTFMSTDGRWWSPFYVFQLSHQ